MKHEFSKILVKSLKVIKYSTLPPPPSLICYKNILIEHYNFRQKKNITRTFVCLAEREQLTVPTSREKLVLRENGLGEKKVQIPANASKEKVKDVLYKWVYKSLCSLSGIVSSWLCTSCLLCYNMLFGFEIIWTVYFHFQFPGLSSPWKVVADLNCYCVKITPVPNCRLSNMALAVQTSSGVWAVGEFIFAQFKLIFSWVM